MCVYKYNVCVCKVFFFVCVCVCVREFECVCIHMYVCVCFVCLCSCVCSLYKFLRSVATPPLPHTHTPRNGFTPLIVVSYIIEKDEGCTMQVRVPCIIKPF